MRRVPTRCLLLLGGLMFRPAGGTAQNVTLDEGTFDVRTQDGATGTEAFTIRRAGAGIDARVIAQARIQWTTPEGSRDVVPLLEARGLALALYAYQVEVSGDRTEEVYLRAEGRRFVANVRSDEGEQQREFRARPGSVILEQGVAHHYFLLGPALTAPLDAVPVLAPLTGELSTYQISVEEGVPVRIGDRTLDARHVTLASGEDRQEVWLDAAGRVLRVEVPSLGYEAVRRDPPRG